MTYVSKERTHQIEGDNFVSPWPLHKVISERVMSLATQFTGTWGPFSSPPPPGYWSSNLGNLLLQEREDLFFAQLGSSQERGDLFLSSSVHNNTSKESDITLRQTYFNSQHTHTPCDPHVKSEPLPAFTPLRRFYHRENYVSKWNSMYTVLSKSKVSQSTTIKYWGNPHFLNNYKIKGTRFHFLSKR